MPIPFHPSQEMTFPILAMMEIAFASVVKCSTALENCLPHPTNVYLHSYFSLLFLHRPSYSTQLFAYQCTWIRPVWIIIVIKRRRMILYISRRPSLFYLGGGVGLIITHEDYCGRKAFTWRSFFSSSSFSSLGEQLCGTLTLWFVLLPHPP